MANIWQYLDGSLVRVYLSRKALLDIFIATQVFALANANSGIPLDGHPSILICNIGIDCLLIVIKIIKTITVIIMIMMSLPIHNNDR